MKVPKEVQVVIPYETLVELLIACEELPKMQQHIKRQDEQLGALRRQFVELMEAFGQFRKII